MRRKIARRLRNLADRVDPSSGPRAFPGYFNIVPVRGLVITQTNGIPCRQDLPGVPLWYMAEDYDRAWSWTEPVGRVVEAFDDAAGLRIRWNPA